MVFLIGFSIKSLLFFFAMKIHAKLRIFLDTSPFYTIINVLTMPFSSCWLRFGLQTFAGTEKND